MSVLDHLELPIIAAPMAGGPSTPELVRAVADAGGMGFLAGGYLSGDQLTAHIEQVAGTRLFGVNLFLPQTPAADSETEAALLADYVAALQPLADELGVELSQGPVDHTDRYEEKLAALLTLIDRGVFIPVVSFMFGRPSEEVVARLHAAGAEVWATVTTVEAAVAARRLGVEALIVQGREAGGHRGTATIAEEPNTASTVELLTAVRREVPDCALVAAGGLTTPEAVAAVRDAGARAAVVGTGFLLAEEAGTPAAYREALSSGAYETTTLTRAFSGRYARGLRNEFIERFDAAAPPVYPGVNGVTGPLRGAGKKLGRADLLSLWAGENYRDVISGTAAEIARHLAG